MFCLNYYIFIFLTQKQQHIKAQTWQGTHGFYLEAPWGFASPWPLSVLGGLEVTHPLLHGAPLKSLLFHPKGHEESKPGVCCGQGAVGAEPPPYPALPPGPGVPGGGAAAEPCGWRGCSALLWAPLLRRAPPSPKALGHGSNPPKKKKTTEVLRGTRSCRRRMP